MRHKIGAILRALAGLSFNVVLVWLCLFLLARPAGWLVSSVHPELRARLPIVKVENQPTLAAKDLHISLAGTEIRIAEKPASVGLQLEGPAGTRHVAASLRFEPGRLSSLAPDADIAEQPRLIVEDPLARCPDGTDLPPHACDDVENRNDRPYVRVAQQVKLSTVRGATTDAGRPLFLVAQQPAIEAVSGTSGRPEIDLESWMWVVVLGLLAAAATAAVVGMMLRSARGDARSGKIASWFAYLALAAFAWLVLLPWLVQSVPHAFSSLASHLPGALQSASPGDSATYVPALGLGGIAATLATAARGLFAKRPRMIGGAIATLAVYAVLATVAITFMSYAAASGPAGRFTGFGLGWWGPMDIVKAAILAFALAALTVVTDVNAWSLYTFYKQRLQSAYILDSTDSGGVTSPGFDEYVCLDAAQNPNLPELVLCAAANVTDEGVTPPGRNAVSYTFSATEVGGPDVAWTETTRLYDRLNARRQKDVTLTAAMAISGAAVSPAMGKKTMPGFAPLLALLNVRLGVWLPHPIWVNAQVPGFRWQDKPRLQHLFMEVFGLHRWKHPYLYVTDGGHWDNLGLVELLRRGCTEIYCFDASGDHVDTFFTIGEAVSLARAELGVDITIRPDSMRPPLKPDDKGRNLRRSKTKPPTEDAPAPVAHVCGTFLYPPDAQGHRVQGRLVIAKAAITDDVPWDVFAYAEKQDNFPTNSTLEQLYTDEKFEAYRELGTHLARRALLTMQHWPRHAVIVSVPVDGTGTSTVVAQVTAALTPFGAVSSTTKDHATFLVTATGDETADALFDLIAPALVQCSLPLESFAVKRYGNPGAPQKQVPLA